ncbi:MAG: hypothetical protein FWC79_02070 [Oscillospiraceae bacterium]|nr:hypothetical protein [Oscillospiraceae bacterium]
MWQHGNEGFGGHHYEGLVKQGEILEVEFAVRGGLQSLYLTLWKDFADDFEVTLVAPNGESMGPLLPNEKNRNTIIGGTSVFFLNTQPVPYNEEQENFFLLKPSGMNIRSTRRNMENKNKRDIHCDRNV